MERVLDAAGWPIVPGARVVARFPDPRLPLVRGEVRSVGPREVEITEHESFARRTMRPEQCRVQRGKTQASKRHAAMASAGRRGR